MYNKKTHFTKKLNIDFVKTSKYLLILESQSKILHVEKILGKEYQAKATCGHICNIDGLNGIDINNNFEPEYKIIDSKKNHIKYIASIIKQYEKDNIFLGTDDDSEGHKVAYDVCKTFDLPLNTTKRIIFHEITASALNRSIMSPTTVNINIVKSQQVRQIIDILIGFKISPMLWKYTDHDKTKSLSVGRCQSVALKIIYANYQENIQKLETEITYKTVGSFLTHPYTLECVLSHNFTTITDVKNFLVLSKLFIHEVKIGEKNLSIKHSPLPFNTASILQKSDLPPKVTMILLEQLYQEGLITYIRTESTKYSSEILSQMEIFLLGKFNNKDFVGDFTKIVNENGQLPHEAIRVTDLKVEVITGDKN
jgi:DNA topoisomerase I